MFVVTLFRYHTEDAVLIRIAGKEALPLTLNLVIVAVEPAAKKIVAAELKPAVFSVSFVAENVELNVTPAEVFDEIRKANTPGAFTVWACAEANVTVLARRFIPPLGPFVKFPLTFMLKLEAVTSTVPPSTEKLIRFVCSAGRLKIVDGPPFKIRL